MSASQLDSKHSVIEDADDPYSVFERNTPSNPRRMLHYENEDGSQFVVEHPSMNSAKSFMCQAKETDSPFEDEVNMPSALSLSSSSSSSSASSSSSSSSLAMRPEHKAPEDEYKMTRADAFRYWEQQQKEEFKDLERRLALLNARDEEKKSAASASSSSSSAAAASPKKKPLPFASSIKELVDTHKTAEATQNPSSHLMPWYKAMFDPNIKREMAGEARYRHVLNTMEEITQASDFTLESAQRTFVTEYLKSCAPLVFGKEWKNCALKFLQKNKMSKIHYQVMALTPRRFGKTWSICVFVLALILCVPRLKVIIISQNRRTSVALLKIMKTFLHRMPNGAKRIATESTEKIEILPEEDADKNLTLNQKREHTSVSSVTALPSTIDGKRASSFLLLLYARMQPSERVGDKERLPQRSGFTRKKINKWTTATTTTTSPSSSPFSLRSWRQPLACPDQQTLCRAHCSW